MFENMLDDIFDDIIGEKHEPDFEIFKLTDFRDSRLNNIKEIFSLCFDYRGKLFLCGGWLRWFLNYHLTNQMLVQADVRFPRKTETIPAKDVDLYCKDQDTFDGVKKIFRYKLRLNKAFESPNAITYARKANWLLPPIQLIKPLQQGKMVTMGTLREILSNFDFTIIRVGMDHDLLDQNSALIDVNFKEDELNHKLVVKNIHCPVSSLQRVIKYCKKGYTIRSKELIKFFIDWENRDSQYKKDLVDFFKKMDKLSPVQIKDTYSRLS